MLKLELHIFYKVHDMLMQKRRFDLLKNENNKRPRAWIELFVHVLRVWRARRGHIEQLSIKQGELSMGSKMHSSEASPEMRHIRVLENRLDKVMIKYNEAQSIRKTYEAIVKRLKDERIGFDNQLAAIERTLKAKERDYEELLLLSHDAYHAKAGARPSQGRGRKFSFSLSSLAAFRRWHKPSYIASSRG